MGASRQTASLWFWLFQEGKHYKKFKRTFKELIRSEYFWEDSFGCYINKYIICKLFGHLKAQWIDDCNNIQDLYCFSCKSKIDSREK